MYDAVLVQMNWLISSAMRDILRATSWVVVVCEICFVARRLLESLGCCCRGLLSIPAFEEASFPLHTPPTISPITRRSGPGHNRASRSSLPWPLLILPMWIRR